MAYVRLLRPLQELSERKVLLGVAAVIGLAVVPARAGVILADQEPLATSTAPVAASTTALATFGPTDAIALSSVGPSTPEAEDVRETVRRHKTFVTAYTSSPEETDDDPFITASGKHVRDGIVAANYLPLGTRIRIPEYFGNRVFVVEDRMHPRMKNVVDIWMDNKEEALKFGSVYTEIEIVEE